MWSKVGPIACSPFADIYTLDDACARRISFKTAALQETMASQPSPRYKSFEVMTLESQNETVLAIVPGRNLVITEEKQPSTITFRCRSLHSREILCDKRCAYDTETSRGCEGGCMTRDGQRWIIPFIAKSR